MQRWIWFVLLGNMMPLGVYAADMDAFREAISGNTVYFYHKKKDISFTRYFAKDGTFYEERDEEFRKGEWSIDGEQLCIAFSNQPVKCRKVKGDSDEYALANRKGKKRPIIVESIDAGNTLEIPAELLGKSAESAHEELITVQTRDGVEQRFLLMEPAGGKPDAVVMLYVGHDGTVEFRKVGKRYVVTTTNGGLPAHAEMHKILLKKNIAVALVALPSDQSFGLTTEFRESMAHAEDAAAVIDFLNKRYQQKVYLHGHCRASFSPAAIATNLNNKGIAGLVLSSTRSQGRYGSVMELKKGAVKVPVLLVHHVDDPCDGTPYSKIGEVKAFYEASSPNVKLITVRGGDGNRDASMTACGGGHHTFKGQQKEVARAIRNWLLKKPVVDEITDEVSDDEE